MQRDAVLAVERRGREKRSPLRKRVFTVTWNKDLEKKQPLHCVESVSAFHTAELSSIHKAVKVHFRKYNTLGHHNIASKGMFFSLPRWGFVKTHSVYCESTCFPIQEDSYIFLTAEAAHERLQYV